MHIEVMSSLNLPINLEEAYVRCTCLFGNSLFSFLKTFLLKIVKVYLYLEKKNEKKWEKVGF